MNIEEGDKNMYVTCYIVREHHKDLGVCYVGHEFVLVRDPLHAWKFESVDSLKKKIGEPVTNPYEIVPMRVTYHLKDDEITICAPEAEDVEE